MWHTMLNVFRSVYTLIFIYNNSTFFPPQKCQPIDRMSIRYRTVALIEGRPDPDFDPR